MKQSTQMISATAHDCDLEALSVQAYEKGNHDDEQE
jgi:hypothetical protein